MTKKQKNINRTFKKWKKHEKVNYEVQKTLLGKCRHKSENQILMRSKKQKKTKNPKTWKWD